MAKLTPNVAEAVKSNGNRGDFINMFRRSRYDSE